VRGRQLRGPGGVYHGLELIRQSLVGFKPQNYSKAWLVRIAFEKRDRGLWWYLISIGMQGMIAEDYTPPTAPKLKTATADFSDNQYNN
jgi:hypothetical protein